MAHFAKLDENNIVTQVLVVNNEVLLKTDGTESEYKGKVFLNELFGSATWVQTSINRSFRGNFAGIGYVYDQTNDVFVAPKPFESWVLNDNYDWEAPNPIPNDHKKYQWNEDTLTWDLYTPTQPYSSWTWSESDWDWIPPTTMPTDGQPYEWNEDDQTWDLIS